MTSSSSSCRASGSTAQVSNHAASDNGGSGSNGGNDQGKVSIWQMCGICALMPVITIIEFPLKVLIMPIEAPYMFKGWESMAVILFVGISAVARAAAAIVAPKSDQSLSPYGRRRPFLFLGLLFILQGVWAMWLGSMLQWGWLFFLGNLTSSFGVGMGFILTFALMNDVVPENQIGISGAILSVGGLLGLLGGFGYCWAFVKDDTSPYYCLVISAACLTFVPYLFAKEQPLKRKTRQVQLLDKLWRIFTDPLERDWLKACILNGCRMAEDGLTPYKIWFVRDFMGATTEQEQLALVASNIMIVVGVAAPVTILVGYLTDFGDRLQRRKMAIYFWGIFNTLGYALALYGATKTSNRILQAWLWRVCALLWGIGIGCQGGPINSLGMDCLANQEETATAKTLKFPMNSIANFIGSALIGFVFLFFKRHDGQEGYSFWGYVIAFVLSSGWTVVGGIVTWSIGRRHTRRPSKEALEESEKLKELQEKSWEPYAHSSDSSHL